MSAKQVELRLFLDEGVPDSVGRSFSDAGHTVFYLRDAIAPGSPDQLVCTVAEANDAILVAFDGDMRRLAQRRSVSKRRFRSLSLIKLSCRQSKAADRVHDALSLIDHEWQFRFDKRDRRIFIEIGTAYIKTNR